MLPEDERLGDDPELAVDLMLHEAYEAAYQRQLLARLGPHLATPTPPTGARKAFQAAFCIDVRSEVYRRALETVCPDAETIGFAGFFGFPIEYVPIGRDSGGAQCPVLLKPAFVVCEAVADASEPEETEILNRRLLRRRAAKAWKAFKLSAVSSFTYVETAGLLFAGKLVGDSARLTRTVSDPNTDGLDESVIDRVGPRLAPRAVAGRLTGFDDAQRVAMAEAVLRAMSMTQDFAPLVLLTGHGSTTVNNPMPPGSIAARAAAHRRGERPRRRRHPQRSGRAHRPFRQGNPNPGGHLVPGLPARHHDRRVHIFDADDLPANHAADLAALRRALAKASSLARAERALGLGIGKTRDVDDAVKARSRDWAQVRPNGGSRATPRSSPRREHGRAGSISAARVPA